MICKYATPKPGFLPRVIGLYKLKDIDDLFLPRVYQQGGDDILGYYVSDDRIAFIQPALVDRRIFVSLLKP